MLSSVVERAGDRESSKQKQNSGIDQFLYHITEA